MFNFLFSFLFPSWNFFDDTYEMPMLLYKADDNDWQLAIAPIRSRLYNIFFNPNHNLYLFIHTSIHRLLNDLKHTNDLNSVETNPHYLFLKNYVENIKTNEQSKNYQFKLSMIKFDFNNQFKIYDDILISKKYDLND